MKVLWFLDRFGLPGSYHRMWAQMLRRADLTPRDFECFSLHSILKRTLLQKHGTRKAPTWIPDEGPSIIRAIDNLIAVHKPNAVVLTSPESLACLGLHPDYATLHNLRGSVYWRSGVPHIVMLPMSAWLTLVSQKEIGAANYGFESQDAFAAATGQARSVQELESPHPRTDGRTGNRDVSQRPGMAAGAGQRSSGTQGGNDLAGSAQGGKPVPSVPGNGNRDSNGRHVGRTAPATPTPEHRSGSGMDSPFALAVAAGAVRGNVGDHRGDSLRSGGNAVGGESPGHEQVHDESLSPLDGGGGRDELEGVGDPAFHDPAGTGRYADELYGESDADDGGLGDDECEPEEQADLLDDSGSDDVPGSEGGETETAGGGDESVSGDVEDHDPDQFFYEPVLSPVGRFVLTADTDKLKRILDSGERADGPTAPIELIWR